MPDLLTPLPDISDDKLHWAFKHVIANRKYAPARDKLREVWEEFPNPDAHFVSQFQTTGFDARIWELALAAVGQFGPYTVSRPREAPDFLFERDGIDVWVEATTANPSATRTPDIEDSADELGAKFHELNDVVPIRLGSSLYSKLTKAYWNQAHVAGQPFVIAIEDFGAEGPIRTSDASLFRYLYGMEHRVVSIPGDAVKIEAVKVASHKHGNKEIPSGFFDLPDAENVSAVIFSNEGTLMKFNRMGFSRDRHHGVRMVRIGLKLNFDPAATAPQAFGYLVGDFEEEWEHGMNVYHNPNATHPIPVGFFEGFSGHHWFENGRYENLFRSFSPYLSLTATHTTTRFVNQRGVLDRFLRREADRKARQLSAHTGEAALLAWHDKFVG